MAHLATIFFVGYSAFIFSLSILAYYLGRRLDSAFTNLKRWGLLSILQLFAWAALFFYEAFTSRNACFSAVRSSLNVVGVLAHLAKAFRMPTAYTVFCGGLVRGALESCYFWILGTRYYFAAHRDIDCGTGFSRTAYPCADKGYLSRSPHEPFCLKWSLRRLSACLRDTPCLFFGASRD